MDSPRELCGAEYAALLPQLDARAHKYSRGCLLVVGGSLAYPGAPVLAALAAARSGAGYVRLAVPGEAASIARSHVLSIPVTACAQRDGAFERFAADEVVSASAKADALVVGPGLTTGDGAAAFLARLLAETDKPLVLDADALNIIAADPALMEPRAGCVNIMTPHEGEAARLLGHAVEDRFGCALELARRYHAVVALKGPGTLCADASGAVRVNRSGGPELAKAGSGDVLSGMVGAFLTQRLQALDCVTLAVYLHGRAGELAAARVGGLSVMPEDIIECIGPAVAGLDVCAG